MKEIWKIGEFMQIALIQEISEVCKKIYYSQIQKYKVENITILLLNVFLFLTLNAHLIVHMFLVYFQNFLLVFELDMCRFLIFLLLRVLLHVVSNIFLIGFLLMKLLNEHLKLGIKIHSAGEWLLDNFYIIEETVKSIEKSLNFSFITCSSARCFKYFSNWLSSNEVPFIFRYL